MCFLNKKVINLKNRRKKKQTLMMAAYVCVCIFGLSGCGRISDFHESLPDVEEIIDNIVEEETKEEAEETEAASSKEVSEKVPKAQEYPEIEENQVEEGTSSLSREDQEKRREEIGLSEADIVGLQEIQFGNYYFEQLTSSERRLYVELYRILEIQAEEILVSTLDAELLPRVYQCVINDHPEFFYMNGYTYTQYTRQDEIQYITFSGRYIYDADEVARRQERIDAVVEEKAGTLVGIDDYETVKNVYEDLILSTDYSMDSPDNQNICSVFLDRKSVCNGYAKAAQYLLNYLGIPCIIVNGTALGAAHAWNIVEIDGAYYHMDVTWGDPSYYAEEAEEKNGAPSIDYSYLLVTTAEISRNHTISTEFRIPECSFDRDNYFVREGIYLYGYDEGRMEEIFDAAKSQGKNTVIIKACDRQAYNEIYDNLINEQKIFDYFGVYQSDGEYKVAYSGNEELYTISFWE